MHFVIEINIGDTGFQLVIYIIRLYVTIFDFPTVTVFTWSITLWKENADVILVYKHNDHPIVPMGWCVIQT